MCARPVLAAAVVIGLLAVPTRGGPEVAGANGGTTRNVRLAVLVVSVTGDPATNFWRSTTRRQEIRDHVFGEAPSVASYWRESTAGANTVNITGDVFGPYTLSAGTCVGRINDWMQEARAAAGTRLAGYTHFMLWMANPECDWAGGLAPVPGDISWINLWGDGVWDYGWMVAAHEFGHNLGLSHAKTADCGTVPLSLGERGCKEVGVDRFEIMGGTADGIARRLTAARRAQLGAVTPTVVPPGANKMQFRFANPEQALVIPRRCSAESFWLEYRMPYGSYDTADNIRLLTGKVTVRLVDTRRETYETRLLDMSPDGKWNGDFADPGMAPGASFTDPEFPGLPPITFSVVSADASGATVEVTTPPTTGCAAVVSGVLTVTTSPGVGDTLTVTPVAGTNDRFRVARGAGTGFGGVAVGNGCRQANVENAIVCSGVRAISIDTNDGDDAVRVATGDRAGDDGYGTGVNVLDVYVTTGAGEDFVYTDGILNANFTVSGGAGNDILRTRTSAAKDAFNEQVGFGYATATLDGGDDDDVLVVIAGSMHPDFRLSGGNGNDRIYGGAGWDFALGGDGDDIINVADGTRYNTTDCGGGTDRARINSWDAPSTTACEGITAV